MDKMLFLSGPWMIPISLLHLLKIWLSQFGITLNMATSEWALKTAIANQNKNYRINCNRTKELHLKNKAESPFFGKTKNNKKNFSNISKDVLHETILPEGRI